MFFIKLLCLEDAAIWASKYLKEKFNLHKKISKTNIYYLVQQGRIKKYKKEKRIKVNIEDLKKYYNNYYKDRKKSWENIIGDNINWNLSFENLREKETTKHVHRLHPYKGKFIPQLVEYFIDSHTDEFKVKQYFKPEDILIDPFMGSGTTLVQAKELGIHGIGIDVSKFNCLIAECKMQNYDIEKLNQKINHIIKYIENMKENKKIANFQRELNAKLGEFNKNRFHDVNFKYKINQKEIEESEYSKKQEKDFLKIYFNLTKKYNIKLKQDSSESFLDKWYIDNIRKEINYIINFIDNEEDLTIKKLLQLILSRTIRASRATTHSNLASLKEPQLTSYYCYKHKKICKPVFSIKNKFKHYAKDSINRIQEFKKVRTSALHAILCNDSRHLNIFEEIKKINPELYKLVNKQKINGIFTSPPYIGQINYHEQHAYAYEVYNFSRKDDLEIGKKSDGKSKNAQNKYIQSVSAVLINCKKFLKDDYDIFIVANDKYNLYEKIIVKSEMKIINKFNRPVLNRTSRDRKPYSETIFHIKEQ